MVTVLLPNPTPKQLYDLWLIGLTWLRRYESDEIARLGSSVFRALRINGIISEPLRKRVHLVSGLVTMTQMNMEKMVGPQKTGAVIGRAKASEKHIIVRTPSQYFNSTNLFSHTRDRTMGYKIVVTEVGIAYAMSQLPNYADFMDYGRFIDAWKSNTKQMRAAHANMGEAL